KGVEELRGVETEHFGVTKPADHLALIRTAERVRGVKQQAQTVAVRERGQRADVTRVPPDVDPDDAGRLRRDGCFHRPRVEGGGGGRRRWAARGTAARQMPARHRGRRGRGQTTSQADAGSCGLLGQEPLEAAYCSCHPGSLSLISFAGTPTEMVSGGISFVTTAPAPTTAHSPMAIPWMMTSPVPISQPVLTCTLPETCTPGAMVQKSSMTQS